MKKKAQRSYQDTLIHKRRQKKRAAREHERKLVRKLNRMATRIHQGDIAGVKDSPLLLLNWRRVKRWLA